MGSALLLILLLLVGVAPRVGAQTTAGGFTGPPSFGPGRFIFTDVETGALWLVDPVNGTSSVVTTFHGDLAQLRVAAAATGATSVWVGTTGWRQLMPTSVFTVASPLTVMLIKGPLVPAPTGSGSPAPVASGTLRITAGLAAASGCPVIATPPPEVASDGSRNYSICATVRTAGGAPAANQVVLVSTVLGGLGPGAVKSVVTETDAQGNIAVAYRGTGAAGTDTVAVSDVSTPTTPIEFPVTLVSVVGATPVGPSPTPTSAAPPTTAPAIPMTGTFATAPRFDASGRGLVVFGGGSVDQLASAVRQSGASGAWVQDQTGAFQLLITNGPAFLADAFRAAFPGGLSPSTAVLLSR